jgi:hypothetical protein
MTREQRRKLPIQHIGNVLAICNRNVSASLREDLDYKRYKGFGVRERFRNEEPYRICARCLARIRKRENATRRLFGERLLK